MSSNMNVTSSVGTSEILEAQAKEAIENAEEVANEQEVANKEALRDVEQEGAGVPAKAQRRLQERVKTSSVETVSRAGEESVLVRKDNADAFAQQFNQGRNQQFGFTTEQLSQLAQSLGKNITPDSDVASILNYIREEIGKTQSQPAQPAQINKVLEFLIEFSKHSAKSSKDSQAKGEFEGIQKNLEKAQIEYQSDPHIKAAIQETDRYIELAAVRAESGVSVNVAESMQEVREMIHNPPEFAVLFKKFSQTGKPVETAKMELNAILHTIGVNLKRGLEVDETS